MTRFAARKLPGDSKAVSKSQKIKPLLNTEALSIEYLWKISCLFTSDFIASYFVLSLHFQQCFLIIRTSLCRRFELIEIYKAIDVRAGGARGVAAPPVPEKSVIFRAKRSKFGQQHLGEKNKNTGKKKRNNGFHSKKSG